MPRTWPAAVVSVLALSQVRLSADVTITQVIAGAAPAMAAETRMVSTVSVAEDTFDVPQAYATTTRK